MSPLRCVAEFVAALKQISLLMLDPRTPLNAALRLQAAIG